MTSLIARAVHKAMTAAFTAIGLALAAQPALALEKIPFTLNWKLGGIHGAVFLAMDRGYFKEEGLELDVVAGDGSANVVNRLASGAYQVGMGDIASVIRFNTLNPDRKVKAIYNQTPADLAVVTIKGRGIMKPMDLKGRKVGAPVGDTAYKMFPAFSAATGIKASDITWEHMAPNIREAMLLQGKVDAITANEGTAYFNMKGAGVKDEDMVFIRYNENGVNLINIGFMANESYIKSNPETVRKILRGLHRGFVAAIEEPKAAIDALLKRDPLLKRDIEMARLKYAVDRMVGQPDAKSDGLGFYTDDTIKQSIDIVAAAEKLSKKIAVEDVIDMSFLPPASERAIPSPKTN